MNEQDYVDLLDNALNFYHEVGSPNTIIDREKGLYENLYSKFFSSILRIRSSHPSHKDRKKILFQGVSALEEIHGTLYLHGKVKTKFRTSFPDFLRKEYLIWKIQNE